MRCCDSAQTPCGVNSTMSITRSTPVSMRQMTPRTNFRRIYNAYVLKSSVIYNKANALINLDIKSLV